MKNPLQESIIANSLALVTENRLTVDHDFLLLPTKSIVNSIRTSKITKEQAAAIRHHATSGAIIFKLWSLKPLPNVLMWDLCTFLITYLALMGSHRS